MDKTCLTRLAITGLIDIKTPKCVLIDIADAHRIKYKKEDFEVGNNLAKLINTINNYKFGIVKKPYSMNELKYIAHFLNKNARWTKNKAEQAFEYLMSFTEYKKLREIPENFSYGLQTPSNIQSLNASVLFAICKANHIETEHDTTIHQMAGYIKLLYSMNEYSTLPNYDIQRSLKTEIFNILKYNQLNTSDMINILSKLNPLKLKEIISTNIGSQISMKYNIAETPIKNNEKTIALRIFLPSSVTYKQLEKTYNRIHSNINNMMPNTHLEAIVMAAVKYDYDISSSISPLAEYRALIEKPHFPYDKNFADKLRRADLNSDSFDNPRLRQRFNINFPRHLYSNSVLDELCRNEGITSGDLRLESAYSLLCSAYLTETFVHGKHNKITNKINTEYDEIETLDNDDVICYGVRGLNLTAFTYNELCTAFRVYRRYQNPSSKNNHTFNDKSIKRLMHLASKERRPNERLASYNSRSKLADIITQVKLYKNMNNQIIKDFARLYDRLMKKKQLSVQNIFTQLLHSAMYMRGWKGKGKYPLKSTETYHNDTCNVEVNVHKAIHKLEYLCSKVGPIGKNILNLPLICYNSEFRICTNNEEGKTIGERIEIVKLGNQTNNTYSCIRMSSNRLAASAYYYMQILKMDKPFNINLMAKIS